MVSSCNVSLTMLMYCSMSILQYILGAVCQYSKTQYRCGSKLMYWLYVCIKYCTTTVYVVSMTYRTSYYTVHVVNMTYRTLHTREEYQETQERYKITKSVQGSFRFAETFIVHHPLQLCLEWRKRMHSERTWSSRTSFPCLQGCSSRKQRRRR